MKKILVSALLLIGLSAVVNAVPVEITTMTTLNVADGWSEGPQWVVGMHVSSGFQPLELSFQSPNIATTNALGNDYYTSTGPATTLFRAYHATGTANNDGASGTFQEWNPRWFPRGVKLHLSNSSYNLISIETIKEGGAKLPE